jgi:serine/threonine protein kinase
MRLLDAQWIKEQIVVIDFGQSFLLPPLPSPLKLQHGQQQRLHAPSARQVGTPLGYCAPELLFDSAAGVGAGTSFHTDIWALGCTLFEIRAGGPLFATFFGGRDEVVRQMVQTLGKLPEPWWSEWTPRKRYFNDDGRPRSEWEGKVPLAVAYPLGEMVRDIGGDDGPDDKDGSDQGRCDSGELSPDSPREQQKRQQALLEARGTRLSEVEASCLEDLLSNIIRYSPNERMDANHIVEHAWFKGQF